MKIELHHNSIIFENLRPEWNMLVQNSGANTPFSTWEFLATWWDVYQSGQLWLVSARTDQDELVGLMPMFLDDTGQLCSIGGLDVTDYCDVIAHRDHERAVYSAFSDFLLTHQADFSGVSFYNLRPNTPTLTHLCDLLQMAGCQIIQTQVEVTPHIVLPTTFEAYLESLDKKQRGEVRRKMRRAEAGIEEKIDWYVVGAEHDIQAQMAQFFILMASSSPQKAQFLQNPYHKTFFEKLIPRMQQAGWLRLVFLRVDGEPCASYLNFDYDKRIWVYNSGFSHQHEVLGTGIMLLVYLIEDAIKRGYIVFDFLRGNEVYKYRMGGVDAPLYQLDVMF